MKSCVNIVKESNSMTLIIAIIMSANVCVMEDQSSIYSENISFHMCSLKCLSTANL